MKTVASILVIGLTASAMSAAEYHVAVTGADAGDGSAAKPLRTIQAASNLAQPGDAVTVHTGVYRERVNPPRGGECDAKRITYQAAPGEKVVITGAEPVKGWEKVGNDTWKTVLPNSFFGDFNPFSDCVQGEWCNPTGRHAGMVYLNGDWFAESLSLDPVLKPATKQALWFAKVDGADTGAHLFAIKSISINGNRIAADTFSAKNGELHATACADGDGRCVGWIRAGSWLAFDKVDFGQEPGSAKSNVEIKAGALADGGDVELHLDVPDGDLLGTCRIINTGDWQKWGTFSAPIKPVRGVRTIYLVFKLHQSEGKNTTLWAQFPGVNPNEANVEINARQSVFYPSKTGVNYITVRGLTLRQAATPWAGAMSEQVGLIGTHWSKGWIIEDNDISYSMCTGVTLGRYELPKGEFPPVTAPGFVKSVELALRDGWSKKNVGSHIVRNNHISHCEKNAVHGSLGAAFSEISGNDIHDIAVRNWVQGPDTAGIKFLGGVDMVIRDNHVYRCGGAAGIWLDWMAQGAQVIGNFLHDNGQDIFFEMQHGPLLSANNLFLSKKAQLINSEGLAMAHNLIAGNTKNISDPRATPFHPAHALTIAGLYTACGGDHRVHNNLFTGGWNMCGKLPNVASGNVFTGGVKPFAFDPAPVTNACFQPQLKLVQKADGWYLTLSSDPAWRNVAQCKLVTTGLLGKAKISNCAYENVDGTPLVIDTDYFGKPRNLAKPFPGPFETVGNGPQEIKVWPKHDSLIWPDTAPADCPFQKSETFGGIEFTGRHAEYTKADTWYPSWASDGNLYSPFTDGAVEAVTSSSGPGKWVTGNARVEGDDPLRLKVIPLGVTKGLAAPYGGRYPCGTLVRDGTWYYGTYCLDTRKYAWDIMGPFVGFRMSGDFGKTWTDTPCTPAKPLFGESGKNGAKVKMGSPHFVDFGKNMEHSPDGKAYLLGHGATRTNATCSWISGDQVYLARVTPSPETINNIKAYEFFAGNDAKGEPVWVKEFSKIKPLLEWSDRLGCVTATWNPFLKRYLMCITDGQVSGLGKYDTLILESERLTGPWRRVTWMENFGEQGYFVNIPSKFICPDGAMWLCYAANWSPRGVKSNPPGSRYAMCLREFRLLPTVGSGIKH